MSICPAESAPEETSGNKPGTVSAAGLTTYRIGGPLAECYQPATRAEAEAVLRALHPRLISGKDQLTVLGWGGNTLVASAGVPGPTLLTRKMTWAQSLGEGRFCFGAGVHLARAAKMAQEQTLTGGEYMIGIPGTIGGAIRMNAGALGQETADVTESATLFNLEAGGVETWDRDRLAFAYRRSAIDPLRHVVLEAVMAFRAGNAEDIARMMEGSVRFRKTHHPTEPNGGSVFKNPYPKSDPERGHMSAGWMLEQLGAKAWVEGGVRVSPLHANFIVNVAGGTSADVLRLMARMQRAVREAYGVTLHPENLFLGAATPEEAALWQELSAA